MFHRVKEVKALPDFCLQVHFLNDVSKIYDVKMLIDKYPAFSVFRDVPDEFVSVQTDVGGYGVVWNDDLDISCDELWENGK
ncbi:MAG: DUF2442 domain-containing protein [Clostridia bacterium]|nr:DUF2442 domain-containing protein [Clostridia bacterium]